VLHEIAGLPAHPLLVHAAVVLSPALALVAIGYALLPAARVHSERLLVALAVAAPLSVAIARESGASLQRRLVQEETVAPGQIDQIDAHAASARTLLLLTLALGAASLAWILLKPRLQSTAPAAVLAVVTCTLGAVVLWWVVETGHSGTSMVWGAISP
jgi:hypothetical protein